MTPLASCVTLDEGSTVSLDMVPPDAAGIRAKIERGYYGPAGCRRWRKAVRRFDRAVSRVRGGWDVVSFTFGSVDAEDLDNVSVFLAGLEEP